MARVLAERVKGVHPYRELYLDLDYEPASTDLLVAFRLTAARRRPVRRGGRGGRGGVFDRAPGPTSTRPTKAWRSSCAHGSTGSTVRSRYIAYPAELFEFGSIPNILSSVVGNVFGFKAVTSLKLLDMRLPIELVRLLPGSSLRDRRRSGQAGRPRPGADRLDDQAQARPVASRARPAGVRDAARRDRHDQGRREPQQPGLVAVRRADRPDARAAPARRGRDRASARGTGRT